MYSNQYLSDDDVLEPQDAVTVRIFSSICKVSDCVDRNIALIEDLNKNRTPMPETAGLYFISPSPASVARLAFDFGQYASRVLVAVYHHLRAQNGLMRMCMQGPCPCTRPHMCTSAAPWLPSFWQSCDRHQGWQYTSQPCKKPIWSSRCLTAGPSTQIRCRAAVCMSC
jgi:hypothetical protein